MSRKTIFVLMMAVANLAQICSSENSDYEKIYKKLESPEKLPYETTYNLLKQLPTPVAQDYLMLQDGPLRCRKRKEYNELAKRPLREGKESISLIQFAERRLANLERYCRDLEQKLERFRVKLDEARDKLGVELIGKLHKFKEDIKLKVYDSKSHMSFTTQLRQYYSKKSKVSCAPFRRPLGGDKKILNACSRYNDFIGMSPKEMIKVSVEAPATPEDASNIIIMLICEIALEMNSQ